MNAEACANHLLDALQAVTSWAHQHGLTDGSISVVALAPARRSLDELGNGPRASHVMGLVFSTMPLSSHLDRRRDTVLKLRPG
jgi:hypothetical protein